LTERTRLYRHIAARFGDARLTIELVPKTSWYSNVRSHVSEAEWDRLRKPVQRRAKSQCEICGGRGPTHAVECHEIWRYDDDTSVQELMGLTALCPACHAVKHFGRTYTRGRADEALQHLADVNGWTEEVAADYIALVLELWRLRSEVPWRLDLTWLTEHGITIPERDPAKARPPDA